MAGAKVTFKPNTAEFTEMLRHTRGSLNPCGNVIREVTDQIRDRAKRLATVDADAATVAAAGVKYDHKNPLAYKRAKLRAWQLRAHARRIRAIMLDESDGYDGVTGRVVANYPGSAVIEFGGTDYTVPVGDTDEYVSHPAYGHLRRAMDGG